MRAGHSVNRAGDAGRKTAPPAILKVEFLTAAPCAQEALHHSEESTLGRSAGCGSRLTQVVDIRKGVHCMIPKRVFVGYQHAAHKGS